MHIQNPAIFGILAYLEPCHIRNPGIFRIQDVFRTLSRHFWHIQNAVKCSHIEKLAIFWTLVYLGPEAYSESCLYTHIQAYSTMIFIVTQLTFFLSLRLEEEETLKYRGVCRFPCGKVWYSNDHGRKRKCDFFVFYWKFLFWANLVKKKINQNCQFKRKFGTYLQSWS